MIVKVRMIAFGDGIVDNASWQTRHVAVPPNEWLIASNEQRLELVFHYGQNDNQPATDCCSVSCGDVIDMDGKLFLVLALGYKEITEETFEQYRKMSVEERMRQTFYHF